MVPEILVSNKHALTADYLQKDDDGVHWGVPIRRNTNVWDVEVHLELLNGLCQAVIHFGEEEKRIRVWGNTEKFMMCRVMGSLPKNKRRSLLKPMQLWPIDLLYIYSI